MEKEYWENYYKTHRNGQEETPFARDITKHLDMDKKLIELGCGNGRDSVYFAKNGLNVTGIDQCEEEVEYLNQKYKSNNLLFKSGDFTNMPDETKYDYIYSRFTLHSVDEMAEDRVLKWAYNSLNNDGCLFLELRSLKDNMFKQSKKISETEGVTDHYRRFADFEKLKLKLKQHDFKIVESIEATGLAPYNNEDPVVIRFVARK